MVVIDEQRVETDEKNEWCDELQDEMKGMVKYLKMSDDADGKDTDWAVTAYFMARDEYTHAKAIHEHMDKHKMPIDEATEKMWKETREMAGERFHI